MSEKKILMSIKTKYVNKILDGSKKWEFRKSIPKLEHSDTLDVVIYSSQEDKAIVGEFRAGRIARCSLEELMSITGYEDDPDAVSWFTAYYATRSLCSAIEVTSSIKYSSPISLLDIRGHLHDFRPPQSFMYITPGSDVDNLISERKIEDNATGAPRKNVK